MPSLTLGQAFHEMWELSREQWQRQHHDAAKRRVDFESLAHHCMEQAAAGEECVLYGAKDYPMAKFVCALQNDAYAPVLAKVFSTFIDHGLLDPNKPIEMPDDPDCPAHYKNLNGDLPLVSAVIKGNLHAAELLVLHGADTSSRVPDNVGGFLGEDFFDFVRLHFGETHFLRPIPEERAAAAARLLNANMTRVLSNAPDAPVAPRSVRRARAI